jgi:uncharacterized protein YecT (DUF1311 family)
MIVFAAVASSAAHAGVCDDISENDKLTSCLANEYQKADALLNKKYASVRKSLGKEQIELLKKSQRAWLIVRDTDCEIQASAVAGGQAYEPTYVSCQTAKTQRRMEELKELEQ